MEQIVFADTWESYFQRFSLTTPEEFYRLSTKYKPRQMSTKKAVVVNFEVGENRQEKEFFIKWYLRVSWKNKLRTWRKFGKRYSQARVEWETAHSLLQRGIPTYQPICYGEDRGVFFEKQSFLVTRKLSQPSLAEYLRTHWSRISEAQREILLTSLATFIRHMHDQGILFPDLYTKHIFLESTNSGEYHFTLIDLQRISQQETNRRKQIKDLGALDQSLPTNLVGPHYRYLFTQAYVGTNWPGRTATLHRQIQKRSRHLARRHHARK